MIIIIDATDYSPTHDELTQIKEIMHADTWHHIGLGQADCRYVNLDQDEFARRVHAAVNKVVQQMKIDDMHKTLSFLRRGKP